MTSLKAATVAVFLCFVLETAVSAQKLVVQIHPQKKSATLTVHDRRAESARTKRTRARRVASGTAVIRERLVRVGTAMRDTDLDCSHFTNYVYQRVGLTYEYQPSVQLYQGEGPFVRVLHALPGDLIVWRGHVGIIVDPDEHTFVSKLNSGVKVANWDTRYWKRRGIPRFFRFTGKIQPARDLEFAQDTRAERDATGASD